MTLHYQTMGHLTQAFPSLIASSVLLELRKN